MRVINDKNSHRQDTQRHRRERELHCCKKILVVASLSLSLSLSLSVSVTGPQSDKGPRRLCCLISADRPPRLLAFISASRGSYDACRSSEFLPMGSPMGDLGFQPLRGDAGGGAAAVPAPAEDADSKLKEIDDQGLRVVEWEDLQTSLANLCSVASFVSELHAKKDALAEKLELAIKARKESLHRIDELETMTLQLKIRDLNLENSKVSLQEKSEDVAIAKDKLLPSARSLLVAAKALEAAQSRLQDSCSSLAGEAGYSRLSRLRDMLSARRRLLVKQIAALYPIVPCLTSQQKASTTSALPHSDHGSKQCQSVHDAMGDKGDTLPMTIGGLHVVAPLNIMKPGLYNDSNEQEASATALGYVAHALSLLAVCLDVPLRYPVRFGASRSYIQDYAPAVESNPPETGLNAVGSYLGSNRKAVTEFPLFSEGQDPTRSAYAVFLLNKDLEQVLNYLGAESVGPRHTLPNLNKIIQLVCSGACRVA